MKLTYIPDVEPDKYMEKLKEEIEKDIILKQQAVVHKEMILILK